MMLSSEQSRWITRSTTTGMAYKLGVRPDVDAHGVATLAIICVNDAHNDTSNTSGT